VKRPQSEEFYTEEIDQITDVYAEFAISIIEQMEAEWDRTLVLVEERVDYSHNRSFRFWDSRLADHRER
jgi:hypothetical protein